MTARGVDFLENWIDANVPARPGNWVEALALAQKLRADAAADGFMLEDLELTEEELVKYVFDSMVHLDEPGTPGD